MLTRFDQDACSTEARVKSPPLGTQPKALGEGEKTLVCPLGSESKIQKGSQMHLLSLDQNRVVIPCRTLQIKREANSSSGIDLSCERDA